MANVERGLQDAAAAILLGYRDRLRATQRQLHDQLQAEVDAAASVLSTAAVTPIRGRARAIGTISTLVFTQADTALDQLVARLAHGVEQLLIDEIEEAEA